MGDLLMAGGGLIKRERERKLIFDVEALPTIDEWPLRHKGGTECLPSSIHGDVALNEMEKGGAWPWVDGNRYSRSRTHYSGISLELIH